MDTVFRKECPTCEKVFLTRENDFKYCCVDCKISKKENIEKTVEIKKRRLVRI